MVGDERMPTRHGRIGPGGEGRRSALKIGSRRASVQPVARVLGGWNEARNQSSEGLPAAAILG